MNTKYLLPHRWKRIGWLILIPSTILGLIIFVTGFDFEFMNGVYPAILNKEWAIGESHQKRTFLTLANINYTNSLIGALIIIGSLLVGFSKEKYEDEFISRMRMESLLWSTYVNYSILLLCFLFVFGASFFSVMVISMFTTLYFYIIRFYYMIGRSKKLLQYEKQSQGTTSH